MKPGDYLQTIAIAYQEICEGVAPWVALGNFMNAWFGYATDKRAQLVFDPISLPASLNTHTRRWAAFCAASVEYLCEKYNVPCPSWTHNPIFYLPEPWFDSPGAHKPEVRARLMQKTPEPFTRRNIFCGDRVFANKYELAEQHRRRSA
jgi:hypothetical protein